MAKHRIAVIPGDGIGKEVMPEGVRVVDAAARKFGIELVVRPFRLGLRPVRPDRRRGCPPDWKDQIGGHDCLFFGACGWPARVPDHVSLWDSLIKFRREFDQYVNLRPVRLMPGIKSPLAGRDAGRHRLLDRPREHRGRILGGRRSHVRRHRARSLHAAVDVHAQGHRSHPALCLRAGVEAPEEARDVGDEVQRNIDHDAVLGRACRRHGQQLSRRAVGQVPHRHPHRALRPASRLVRRGRRVESVRRHPVGPRSGVYRHDRHRPVRRTSMPIAYFRRCSSLCMAPRPTSTGRASPIRSARSGRAR